MNPRKPSRHESELRRAGRQGNSPARIGRDSLQEKQGTANLRYGYIPAGHEDKEAPRDHGGWGVYGFPTGQEKPGLIECRPGENIGAAGRDAGLLAG